MVSIDESMPSKSDKFLRGLDIFYVQFNDINFYIEDEDQENLYYCILINLFPTIEFKKIFPLGGKTNVIAESRNNLRSKTKVFIVDRDFDDILNKRESQPNLFYLNRYSIENFLIEKIALINYVIEEKPRLKPSDIKSALLFDVTMKSIKKIIHELVLIYILTQKMCYHISNTAQPIEKFIRHNKTSGFEIKETNYNNFKSLIETELKRIDGRLTLNSQLTKIRKNISIKTITDCLTVYPGKHLIVLIKQHTEHIFNLPSKNVDSFCYRLAKNCEFQSLEFLKVSIEKHIK